MKKHHYFNVIFEIWAVYFSEGLVPLQPHTRKLSKMT